MAFWQIIVLLALAASGFILWPLVKVPFIRKRSSARSEYDRTQIELYHEHLADLERALAAGDIDADQFEELKIELQKTLINEDRSGEAARANNGGKKFMIGCAITVPVLSLVLYFYMGAKRDWDIYQFLQELPEAESQQEYEGNLRQLVVMIQRRLNQQPDNLALLNLLAQTSMPLQDYDQAVDAYRKILEQFPDSPRVIANLAQALFYRAGNTVTPEVRKYTDQALELAPMLPEMHGLAGIDAKNQGNYREAIRHWKLAVRHMDPDSRVAKGYLDGIAKAEEALVAAGETLEEPGAGEVAGDGAKIRLNVALSNEAVVSPDDTVFIYARAWKGAKMPLAIRKLTVAELPTTVVLDESMAMAPGMTINSFPELEVVARVSKSGSPAPQSGDWQASEGPVKIGESDKAIDLTIADQVP